MSSRRLFLAMVGLLLALPALAACGADPAADDGSPDAATDRIVTITMSNKMEFDPSSITVNTHERITIMLRNSGTIEHNFSIDSLQVDKDVGPGATETVIIVAPDKPGQVEFYCNVEGHREAGMVGTLVVEK